MTMLAHLDLRSSWRHLARRPAAAAAAIATLGLAVGGAVAVFALVNAVWLRPLRFAAPERLVTIWDIDDGGGRSNVGWQTFADLAQQSRSLAGAAALSTWEPTWIEQGAVERLRGTRVSASFFDLLGVEPALGRLFAPPDDVRGAHRVLVLSHGLWQRRFGGDPGVVDRTVSFGGYQYRVLGVLPADFDDVFALGGAAPSEVWAPLAYEASQPWACRTCRHLRVIGRLRDGVDLAAARAEIDATARSIAATAPDAYAAPGARVLGLAETVFGPVRPIVRGLALGVALLAALAIANLVGVGLAKVVRRDDEFAVRAALGASGRQLARLVLVEAGLQAAAGALVGLGIARAVLAAALALAPAHLPRFGAAAIGGREVAAALVFAALASATAAAAAALVAARGGRAREGAPRAGGRQTAGSGPRRQLARIVAADVAIGFVLLALAGLMAKSLVVLLAQPPGFQPQSLLTVELTVTGASASEDARRAALFAAVLEQVRALPAVAAAGLVSQLPLGGDLDRYGVHPEVGGNPNPALDPSADRYSVSEGFAETMGVPLLAGRAIAASDHAAAAPVAVLSAALARRLFPDGALGRGVRVGGDEGPWRTVVGVVGDVRHDSLEAVSEGAVYLPLDQFGGDTVVRLVVRAAGEAASLAPSLRAAIGAVSSDLGAADAVTYETLTARSVAPRRFSSILLGCFAATALLMVAVGLYGVVALAAGERRRELGIRRALGATAASLGRALVGRIAALALAGLAVGIGATLLVGRLLAAQLYGTGAGDPAVLALAALVLTLAAFAATAGPLVRSVRVDPASILREE
jgi:putative ABC transport system permease protein